MRPQHIMFLGFIFMCGILISLTLAGAWLGTEEVGVLNSISAMKSVKVLNIWTLGVPNIDFILVGIKALTMMDFAFFGGALEIIRWFLIFTIGAATLWGLFSAAIGTATSLFRR